MLNSMVSKELYCEINKYYVELYNADLSLTWEKF